MVCRLHGIDELAAQARLAEAGIDVMPLQLYGVKPQAPGLVMGFAPYREAAIEQAAREVARLLRRR